MRFGTLRQFASKGDVDQPFGGEIEFATELVRNDASHFVPPRHLEQRTTFTREGGAWVVRTEAGERFAPPVLVSAAGAWRDEIAGFAGAQPPDCSR